MLPGTLPPAAMGVVQIRDRVVLHENVLGIVGGIHDPHGILLNNCLDRSVLPLSIDCLESDRVPAAFPDRVLQRGPAEQQQSEIEESENQRKGGQECKDALNQRVTRAPAISGA